MRTLRLLALLTLGVAALPASACFDPPRPTCAFLCGGQNRACPEDYSCGTDGRCHLLKDDGTLELCDTPLLDSTDVDAGAEQTLLDAE